jgi:hypothetical protein
MMDGNLGETTLPSFDSVLFSPLPMATPENERRSRKRIPGSGPISITSNQSDKATGHVRDLSLTGIFFYTNQAIREGAELEMVMILPEQLTQGEKRWVCCQASVVRVEDAKAEGRLGVAAAIRNMAVLPEIPS